MSSRVSAQANEAPLSSPARLNAALDAEFVRSLVADEPTFNANASTPLDATQLNAEQIMLGFKNLGVSTSEPQHILREVTGYVLKGKVTAVLGASSSGKSVFLKALAGRMQELHVTGDVSVNGRAVDAHSQSNGFGFCPQEDILIGDITVRETFEIAANLRKADSAAENSRSAESVIQSLGLGAVGDNVVGTIVKRGLSGGEKRRAALGQEIVARPVVALLDEPSSGLDGTAAYDVIKTIKQSAAESGGDFSVMLSIHQPDMRILSLFDHLLVLGDGGSLFFGTLNEALRHFADIGHPVPAGVNPADHFLAVTDTAFSDAPVSVEALNFRQEYVTSVQAHQVKAKLNESAALSQLSIRYEEDSFGKLNHHGDPIKTGFWRQFMTLARRDAILAVRDLTLYYLQLVLHIFYGTIVGLAFYDLKPRLDDTINYIPGALVWTLMLNSYVHVFKVFYLVTSNKRYAHERANASYSPYAYFWSELAVTAASHVLFFPGVTIAFFLQGMPVQSYPFFLLVQYCMSMTAEGLLSLITKFTNNAAYAVVACQAALVMLTVFAGGLFIPFSGIPDYWSWLSELDMFSHASRSIMLNVFGRLDYVCPTDATVEALANGTGVCNTVQGQFPCDVIYDADSGACSTSGLSVIDAFSGVSGSYWEYLGYLVLLFAAFRVLILALYIWPVSTIKKGIRELRTSRMRQVVLEVEMEVMRLRSEVNGFRKSAMQQQSNGSSAGYTAVDSTGDALEMPRVALKQTVSSFRKSSNLGGAPTYLTFQNVTVSIPTKKGAKVLIDDVSAHAQSGRVLALMGPSGAGKTTLLNALSGRAVYAKVEGSVKLGNRVMTADDLDYVPQFDDLNGFFTVRELLLYHAMLKTKGDMVKKRVAELIHILGLLPKADTRVTELSHGEQKRVSIGIGLVGEATVLYLDEPTTGLDSAAAHTVVQYITKVAEKTGVVVIMTIHQPSGPVFNMLQDLMLLEHGRLAYFGTRSAASDHFAALGADTRHQSNQSTVFLDMVSTAPIMSAHYSVERHHAINEATATEAANQSKPRGNEGAVTWSQLYSNSAYVVQPPAPEASGSFIDAEVVDRPNKLTRVSVMLSSMLVYYWRNLNVYWLRALELIIVALYVGTIYVRLDTTTDNIGKISGAAFFNTWCVLFAVIAAAPAFVVERRTALQEMLNGAYTAPMYCFVQFVASLPFTVVTAAVFQAIFHFLVGLNPSFESYVYATILTVALLLMMEGIMLMVVEALKNDMLATTFSMVVLGILFLFPGFFVKTEDLPPIVRWMSYVVPTRYSFNGYLYSIFNDQSYSNSDGSGLSGNEVLQGPFKQSASENQWYSLAAVFGYVALFRLGHYALVMANVLPYTKKNLTATPAFSAKSKGTSAAAASVAPSHKAL